MLTDVFAAAVRRQGVIPQSYAVADILAAGDDEIRAVFLPILERVRQDHLVRTATITADALGRYQLPKRAVTGGLRSVQLQINNLWVSLPQRQMEEVDFLTSGQPAAYFLDAGSIILLPSGTSGTLRVRYAARPSAMVTLTGGSPAAASISTVTVGSTTTAITCTANGITGTAVDIIGNGPTHPLKAIEAVIQSGTITTGGPVTLLNSDLFEAPTNSAVSYVATNAPDFICQAGVTPVVPLPEELTGALIHRTTGSILRALGYLEESAAQFRQAEEAIAGVSLMLTPRNPGNPQTVRGGIRRALRAPGRWRW